MAKTNRLMSGQQLLELLYVSFGDESRFKLETESPIIIDNCQLGTIIYPSAIIIINREKNTYWLLMRGVIKQPSPDCHYRSGLILKKLGPGKTCLKQTKEVIGNNENFSQPFIYSIDSGELITMNNDPVAKKFK